MRRLSFLAALATTRLITAVPMRSRTLRLAASPLGNGIDPYLHADPGVDELAWLYGDGLVGGIDALTRGLSATLPEARDGGLTYRYQLAQTLWHDGLPVRAADVRRAFEAVAASPWGTREPYRSVREIVILDDRRFDVRLSAPRRGFVRTFFGPYGTPALPILRRAAGLPVGTGPFAVRSHPDSGRWRLERWDAGPRGAPAVDAIDLRLLGYDYTANIEMLSGEVDIALPLPPRAINGPYRTVVRPTSTAMLICNTEGPLRDESTRRAFASAVDVPSLQRRYDLRRRELLSSLLMSGANDANFAVALAYDPAAGSVLLRHIGSRTLVLSYVGTSPAHERTMLLLQSTLGGSGIDSTLRPASPLTYSSLQGPLRTGRFDVAISGVSYGADADLRADWSCANHPPRGGNFARWCDVRFESALARHDEHGALMRIYQSLPAIPLSRAYELIGVAQRIGGFIAPAPLVPVTYQCQRWMLL